MCASSGMFYCFGNPGHEGTFCKVKETASPERLGFKSTKPSEADVFSIFFYIQVTETN